MTTDTKVWLPLSVPQILKLVDRINEELPKELRPFRENGWFKRATGYLIEAREELDADEVKTGIWFESHADMVQFKLRWM